MMDGKRWLRLVLIGGTAIAGTVAADPEGAEEGPRFGPGGSRAGGGEAAAAEAAGEEDEAIAWEAVAAQFAVPAAEAPEEYAAALTRLAGEPSFAETLEAAVDYAGLDPELEDDLWTRAAWSALLPRVRVTVRRDWEHDEGLDLKPDGDGSFGIDTDDDLEVSAALQWDLAGLVAPTSGGPLRRLALEAEGARRSLRLQVAQAYFERLRLRLQWAAAGEAAAARRAELALGIAERTARLDALTGGFFSRALAAPGAVERDGAWVPSTSARTGDTR